MKNPPNSSFVAHRFGWGGHVTDVVLTVCPSCGRNNNITRMTCIYCGVPLPVAEGEELAKLPPLRPMEETELGFNLIWFPPTGELSATAIRELETVARMETELIDLILKTGVPVPIARAVERADAELIRKRLSAAGLEAEMLPDEDLRIRSQPYRVRRLNVSDESIEVWSSELVEPRTIARREVDLVVVGAVRYKQIQVSEGNLRYGRTREMRDVSETYVDDPVVDFFGGDGDGHYRVRAEAFDYSCLGDRRKLLAAENFKEFVEWFPELVPQAVVDRDFRRATRLMESVWPLTKTTERLPLKRIGVGKISTNSLVFADNANQLTRYGRMRRLLKRY